MFNANEFYIVQIVQEKDKDPRFYVEYFEKDSNGCNLGEWVYIEEYFKDADALGISRATVHPKVTDTIPEMAMIKLFCRLNDGITTSEWIPQGVFYVDTREVDTEAGLITLEAVDGLRKADQPDDGCAGCQEIVNDEDFLIAKQVFR